MRKYTKSTYLLILGLFVSLDLHGMIRPPAGPALSDFDYDGASVLPFTRWPGKAEKYFMLARERIDGSSADKGTYDAFGGRKDPADVYKGNYHPVNTAAREFAEETINLLGNKDAIFQHINVIANQPTNTATIVANRNKKFVVYITEWPHQKFEFLTNNFHAARNRATHRDQKEKDKIAHVKESVLKDKIANAPRDAQGKLILPIKVWATVFEPNGTKHSEEIMLRPVFVSTLQSYFKGQPGTLGKVDKIHFYDR